MLKWIFKRNKSGDDPSALYREAISRCDFAIAKRFISRRLGIIKNSTDITVLTTLLDAATMGIGVVRSTPWKTWKPYVPGENIFSCLPDSCNAACCSRKEMEVGLSHQEISLIEQHAKISPEHFSNSNRIMLKDSQGRCVFLSGSNRCTIYASRPDSCVNYPFKIGYFERTQKGDLWPSEPSFFTAAALNSAVSSFCSGKVKLGIVPLLYNDTACPSFTMEPITIDQYLAVIRQVLELSLCYDLNYFCVRHSITTCSRSCKLGD